MTNRTRPDGHALMVRQTRIGVVGASLLLAAPLIAWLAELVTAAAWQDPPYAPLYNWVSHLGVPGSAQEAFGQVINSPLAWVMNTGWILYGVLAATGLILVLRFRTGIRPILIGALGLVAGIGIILVALVHGSQENVDNGLIVLHLLGAQAAIIAGNLSAVLVGIFQRRLGISRGIGTASLIIGIVGLISFVVFMTDYQSGAEWNLGLFERGAVYGAYLGHALLGASLLGAALLGASLLAAALTSRTAPFSSKAT